MIDTILTRLPPHSIECEQGVLACQLLDPNACVPAVAAHLRNDKYALYDLRHQTIQEALWCMADAMRPIDIITLQSELRTRGMLDQIGGVQYLVALDVPSAANLSYYLDIVSEKYLLRRAIAAATAFVGTAFEDGAVQPLLDKFERDVLALRTIRGSEMIPIKEHVYAALADIEAMFERQGAISGLSTGINDLDQACDGLHAGELILLCAKPSVGKAQPLDANILTPAGFIRMGEIKVGMEVIGLDGKPKIVDGVYPQGLKKILRVHTTDGGMTECCEDHLWLTTSRKERIKNLGSSIKKASDMMNTLKIDKRNSHAIPYCSPVQFSQCKNPIIDPWLLGVWLGDGCISGCAMITNPEPDIIERIKLKLPESDTISIYVGDENHNCPTIRIKRKVRNKEKSDFAKNIKLLGLSDKDCFTKFIPKDYLLGSVSDRISLLRGISDSDGYVNGGYVEISTASPLMAEGIIFLVQSLGGRVSVSEKNNHYVLNGVRHDAAKSSRITFCFTNDIVPVSSKKHLKKFKGLKRKTWRFISKMEYAGEKECQCLSVKGGLYVTDSFIVTHNTALAMNIIEHISLELELPVGVFSAEMSARSLVKRCIASVGRVNMRDIRQGRMGENDFSKIQYAAGKLAASKLHIDDTSDMTIQQVRAKARRMVREYGCKLFAVDYAQLLSSPGAANHERELNDISKGIKSMAKELNVPVILLSQLTEDKTGAVSPKGARAMGEDADGVWLLDRPKDAAEHTTETTEPVTLTLCKQRNEERGVRINLTFLKTFTRFEQATKFPEHESRNPTNDQ